MNLSKKTHPRSHHGNAQKQWKSKPFRATAPISEKNIHLGNLTIIDQSAKTLRKINDFGWLAGDDPGTSKTNLDP